MYIPLSLVLSQVLLRNESLAFTIELYHILLLSSDTRDNTVERPSATRSLNTCTELHALNATQLKEWRRNEMKDTNTSCGREKM
ncbi:hypothetical protein EI94DRAFT_1749489, partial [Lactarius quietus]